MEETIKLALMTLQDYRDSIASIDARLGRTNRILAWAEKDRRRFGNARENIAIVRDDLAT